MVRPDTLMTRILFLAVLLSLGGCASMSARPNYFSMSQQAQSAYVKGDYVRAEKLFLAVLKAVPEDGAARFMLGNIYAKTGRLYKATSEYRQVLSKNPDQPKVWYNLGLVYGQQAAAAFSQSNAHAGKQQQDIARRAAERASAVLSALQGQEHQ
jgi:tetratricopeptide (TPR) repeat protein